MRLLFIADPLESFKVYKDSTFAMMAEAARRGHTLYAMLQDELAWKDGVVIGRHRALSLTGTEDDWYRVGAEASLPLRDFDAVIMRKDPPFDIEYVTSTWLLEHAQRQGARVFNDARAIRDHSEKLAIMQFDRFCVPTLVSRLADDLNAFIDTHRDVILKPLDGMGGTGIFRTSTSDANRNVIIEMLSQLGTRTVMAQRYIPEIKDGDCRVLLIGGKPVPYALARIPKAGETRGNLAAGGTGVARPITPRQREIAEALGPTLAQRGLLLVGLDVIGEHLTEVNCTSPTCFREITAQTGFNVAGMFIDAVEAAARTPAARSV
jgi:glutathione synthase